MKRNSALRVGIGLALALTGAFGLTACGSSDGGDSAESSQVATTDVDIAADLELARTAVLDALEDDPSWKQVMLASDVKQPTQKYGLLVMPYVPSDAVDDVTGTVNIDGGDFVIEGTSVATGQTWQIDQDGNITEVTE
ncbi:MAG: hypothetical protein L6367_10715 [Cellulomonas sp.]|nr:hypothetical protein [Cellulomonas sp.]